MGYSSHTAEFKIECVGRYFSEPPISIRDLAREKGVSFATLAHWIAKARKAGMLNPGEKLPAMVEVAMPPARAEEAAKASGANPATATIAIGKATMMTVIRTALRDGLIPERYLAWLFENSGKLPTERLMPWSDDVPETCKALNRRHFRTAFGTAVSNAIQKHSMVSIQGNHLSIRFQTSNIGKKNNNGA